MVGGETPPRGRPRKGTDPGQRFMGEADQACAVVAGPQEEEQGSVSAHT